MELTATDRSVLAAIEGGLALVPRPFAIVAAGLGIAEAEVIRRVSAMVDAGVIKRMGLVVRHRRLGYRANAMTVWDIPDNQVDSVGRALGALPFVTLCYRRPRRLPDWPYNLFAMIHGLQRESVMDQVASASRALGIDDVPRAILFSTECYKQTGARYGAGSQTPPEKAAAVAHG